MNRREEDKRVLINKFFSREISESEIESLKVWLDSDRENRKIFDEENELWQESGIKVQNEYFDADKAWTELAAILNFRGKESIKAASEEAPGREQSVTPKNFQVKTLWHFWQKVAAIIIIPLLIGTNLWISQKSKEKVASNVDDVVYYEIFAAFGGRTSLRLADSTLVWLNSGSTLKYPNKFSNDYRQVFLKGEAYFEVNNKDNIPFIVQTSTLQVKATGTKFNVQEYSSNHFSEVALVSGKVFVNELYKKDKHYLTTELYPNQCLIYNRKTKEKHITDEDIYKYISWKDGKLIFRNDPLEEVVNKLSMMFNVDIEIRGNELKNYRYRATFEEESLEEILKLLRLSSPVNFKEVERVALPDGSFPKKKVIIYSADQDF